MQISVTGRHFDITDAIRDYTHERVVRTFSDYPRLDTVHVILSVEKYRHRAEVVIHAPHHIRVEAEAESNDMYASLDEALERAERQLRRHWEKMTDHKNREGLGRLEKELQGGLPPR